MATGAVSATPAAAQGGKQVSALSCCPRKRGLGEACADDARPVESRSADFVLDVSDARRVDRPDLLELERAAVETRE
jgi:hypothetical protein